MSKSWFDIVTEKLGKVLGLLVLLAILVPAAFIGYRMLKGVFFPRVDKSAVVKVNQATGEKEYLALGRFHRIQGTPLLVASLNARTGVKDIYYSSYGSKIRNYLFYNIETGEGRWLLPKHSSLFSQSHQLLKDPNARDKGVEFDWQRNEKSFKDPSAEVISVIYEAVLSDTNSDGRLGNEDKKSLMFVNLSEGKVITILEDVDDVLGVEQKSAEDTLVFFTNNQKNFVFAVNSTTGKAGAKTELPAIG